MIKINTDQEIVSLDQEIKGNMAIGGYFGLCAIGGLLSAGTTHVAITPLDVVKVNMQVHPVKYHSICTCFTTLLREQGPSAFWRGWTGKFFGYGAQGACRFGLYEYFKNIYSNALVDQNRSLIFFLSSASAEVIANVALCPFEAIKVRVQAQPNFAKGLVDGFPKIYSSEGMRGLYRGLVPLWGRNLPFSMVMFSTFEHSVNFLYERVIQKRKEDCSKLQQLGVTCLAGYAAGSVGSIISNPADNIVASLNNRKADSFRLTIKKIGFANLFTRSLPIRIMLVGPAVTLQWLFFDTIKVLSGLSNNTPLVHNFNIPTLRESSSGTACGYENVSS
ncbi:mitochondrial carrier protein [Lithospermum erythrorhizon]|uniref:Mitochondrial carrier protein n=1 Tax=Lithospermum erythrorhizon TaxID=34254 RepID=A0AAV3NSX5_LITER